MVISAFVGGPLETIGYLVYDRKGGSALAVDTPLGSTRRFVSELVAQELQLLYIVNTHGHWDHIAGNVALREATNASLCAHSWDATRLANPSLATDDEPALPVPPSRADRSLQDGAMLELGEFAFQVIHTPGHTPGSICLYQEAAQVLFTGDTLYRTAVGRTNFPGGDAVALNKSLKRLAELPDHTRVYPGHGLSTTIGRERWLLELQ
ncbi:MAG: MBL fold metallo-hydrolase [Chloroflexia bacterium]